MVNKLYNHKKQEINVVTLNKELSKCCSQVEIVLNMPCKYLHIIDIPLATNVASENLHM